MSEKRDPEKVVREIRRKTRRKFSAEFKARVALETLVGDKTLAELAAQHDVPPSPIAFEGLTRLAESA